MANSFAILRTKKLTKTAKLKMAGEHNARKMDVPNADPAKGKCIRLMGSDDPFQAYQDKLTELNITERKNGVPAFEVVVSYSPEHKVPVKAWAKAQMAFFEEQYGKGRILSMHLHTDETTPHVHVVVMPIVQKKGVWKLACRDFLGGREKLVALQDDYAKAMAPFGLERGIKNSKATHQKIRKYYGEMHKDVADMVRQLEAVEKPGVFNYKEVVKKLKLMLQSSLLQAAKIGALEEKNATLNSTVSSLQKFKNDISISAKGLTLKEVFSALTVASAQKAEQKRVISEEEARKYEKVPLTPAVAPLTPEAPAKPPASPVKQRSQPTAMTHSMS